VAAKFSIYKYCKTDAGWRYFQSCVLPERKIKPNVVLVRGKEERHTEGGHFLNHRNQWIGVGDDALGVVPQQEMQRHSSALY
jgi:hypothetical protein